MKTRKAGAESAQFRDAWHPMDWCDISELCVQCANSECCTRRRAAVNSRQAIAAPGRRTLPVSGTTPKRSRAVDLFFVSGQLALDPVTREIIEGDASQQIERALQNVATVLKAAGSSLDSVVRCGGFLKNMDVFAAMNAVYGKIFGPHPPARTTVEAARLPKDTLVEIDAIPLE